MSLLDSIVQVTVNGFTVGAPAPVPPPPDPGSGNDLLTGVDTLTDDDSGNVLENS